jgi:hypothetical protein
MPQCLFMIKYKTNLLFFSAIAFTFLIFNACTKNSGSAAIEPPPINNAVYKFSYGDSIIYLKNSAANYKISPVVAKKGHYTSLPEGLNLDQTTGDIIIERDKDGMIKNETGLRYRITFEGDKGLVQNTFITLSGINYADRYYRLSQGDSIAYPIYNNVQQTDMPCTGSGCTFDEGNGAGISGLAVKAANGQINLAQTVRNGLFGIKPENTKDPKEVVIKYRLNDESGKAANGIRVLLYYYNSVNDVPDYLGQLITERQQLFMMLSTNSTNQKASGFSAKPRPPCIIIVGQ